MMTFHLFLKNIKKIEMCLNSYSEDLIKIVVTSVPVLLNIIRSTATVEQVSSIVTGLV